MKRDGGLLVGASDEDIRDNVFHYDEQGGGEEDEVTTITRFHTLLMHYMISDSQCI